MDAEFKKLQGTWNVVTLEVEGTKMGESMAGGGQIVVSGTRFRSVSMGAAYSGTMTLDLAARPKKLDINFTEGPHEGSSSLAIFELDGDTWKICLGLAGRDRPAAFVTAPGSGHALETLRRETKPDVRTSPPAATPAEPTAGADAKKPGSAGSELAAFQGEWRMVSGTRDGQVLPDMFVKSGLRVARGNETTVSFGGQVFLKARFTANAAADPKTIDYTLTDGPDQGRIQLGIYELDGETIRFCFSLPGRDRPTEFASKPGDGRTLTTWKKAEKPDR